ncbi:MAG: hypothetical protein PUJ51_02380 [Clostridiales bacterium]|uniref:hypothetical protein n=1 Tax=Terrisporobacter sp. TaxID=1965305 RepID=UPI002A565E9C|nr:hypothetical protein [Terrisporobacter sp.]MCI6456538.1 hypothetical protein [Clostridium sp.]MDD7753340.1 hypothetical protein [Clostridiales bacterium]MDY4136272.1 hypothetical protein [Terrisporobacter sp.]MDY4737759.1 hypothetical protein [Terrisporobacter sp.]
MARTKRKIDEVEVDEIIKMKLDELGGRKNKLSANNLAKFSKEIANNKKYTRADGSLYNYYGYDFWAGEYKGVPYYGKKRLAEIKNTVNVTVAGKEFLPGIEDILILVDKYHKDPEILGKKLCKIFEDDKKKIKRLTERVSDLQEEKDKLKTNLDDFKRGFASLFLNSNSTDNSLEDVMSVPRMKDGIVSAELQNMFKEDYQEFIKSTKKDDTEEKQDSVTEMPMSERKRDRLRRLKLID